MNERISYLYKKTLDLPHTPGVYIMKNINGDIIYVGKSKSLSNRVRTYFSQFDKQTDKTKALVELIFDFEVIFTETEIEALALENKLIKLHTPKYNIKLKDSKSYPYLKIDLNGEYPLIYITRNRKNDGAKYYGPFSSTSTAYNILKVLQDTFHLPHCSKKFPRDLKTNECINYQIGLCSGVCAGKISVEDYKEKYNDILKLLSGNKKKLIDYLHEKMEEASEKCNYEVALVYRDRIRSIEKLNDKQNTVGNPRLNADYISSYTDNFNLCINVITVRNGVIIDSEFYVYENSAINLSDFYCEFIFNLYKDKVPPHLINLKNIEISEEEIELLQNFFYSINNKKTVLRFPKKGINYDISTLAERNADENMKIFIENDKSDVLADLADMLQMEEYPEKIECYDVSNYSNEIIKVGKISIINGKFDKSNYRIYNIKDINIQDDYYSMSEAVVRRIKHIEDALPDLILVDGGEAHVTTVTKSLHENNLQIKVVGMKKDDKHKTRCLTDGINEIDISKNRKLFNFIYNAQEEVHRFTINKMKNSKQKQFNMSFLENIKGIGPKKAAIILNNFESLNDLKNASVDSIEMINGINHKDALSIYNYFSKEGSLK